MYKRNRRKKAERSEVPERSEGKKPSQRGSPRLDSAFSSGHDSVLLGNVPAFTSGMAGVFPGGESRKKKKLPVPPPWPAGEETIIEKDGEFYEV